MRHLRALTLFPLAAFLIVEAGCPTERMPPPKDPVVEDEWSKLPPSKEWLFATSEFNGPHKAECDHVLTWIKGEESCTATLCEHGVSLTTDWMQRCPKYGDPGAPDAVKTAQGQMGARTSNKPTDCGKRFEEIVRDGCGDDATCLRTGQRWATRCAKSEGTPLTMRILQRTIERKQEQGADPVKLDLRTCDELRSEVMELGKCKDRFACGEGIPKVEAYRDRCESDGERPTLATAVAETTVLLFGQKKPEPILFRGAPTLSPGEVPVMLEDKSGGVITVCDERASDLGRYVNARKGCAAGRMVVARAFSTSKGAEVRVGSLDFPDDATFSARYPTIVGHGELELRDKEIIAALEPELTRAVNMGGAEGARVLGKLIVGHVVAIKRSAAVKQALGRRDEALVPLMKELAKLKLAAAKGKVPVGDAAGLMNRARTRPFADLAGDGTVQLGAPTRALTLDTSAFLPRATEAHAAALKGRGRKVDPKTAKAEHARGVAAAQACGAALKKLSDTKRSLASCNFGLESCDDARQASLVKTVDEARLAAEAAFHGLETARTGGAADDAGALHQSAESAGCREPWW